MNTEKVYTTEADARATKVRAAESTLINALDCTDYEALTDDKANLVTTYLAAAVDAINVKPTKAADAIYDHPGYQRVTNVQVQPEELDDIAAELNNLVQVCEAVANGGDESAHQCGLWTTALALDALTTRLGLASGQIRRRVTDDMIPLVTAGEPNGGNAQLPVNVLELLDAVYDGSGDVLHVMEAAIDDDDPETLVRVAIGTFQAVFEKFYELHKIIGRPADRQ